MREGERPESSENHFKAGLPNHPRTRPSMQKKSCKVNFMPHRSPLARTNELERFSRRGRQRERGAKQRGISLCEHSKRQSTVGEENSPVSSRTGRPTCTYIRTYAPSLNTRPNGRCVETWRKEDTSSTFDQSISVRRAGRSAGGCEQKSRRPHNG